MAIWQGRGREVFTGVREHGKPGRSPKLRSAKQSDKSVFAHIRVILRSDLRPHAGMFHARLRAAKC